ncbi:histone modifying enzyme [Lithospermum erythrorhizon]|uniref:Histone modifying enzyme n=1 Tax=Lithospermum erythrorhizon TaxID=34254 RepID=A0AAV3PTW4_LITER
MKWTEDLEVDAVEMLCNFKNVYCNGRFLDLRSILPMIKDLYQERFPAHYTETLHSLLLREYMNPASELIQAESLTKLCYESSDVVNILAYATDDALSEEQLARIKILMKKKSCDSTNQKEKRCMPSKDIGESGEHDSQSNPDASIPCTGPIEESENFKDMLAFQENAESSSPSKLAAGAHWNIFRQQDVDDPIRDQTFFLDTCHKLRLKEEFDVQPWSFDQNPGEAIIVPAGCPYQIKKLKSSVSIVLYFISPESANKCINMIEEIRLLPLHHKAKNKMFELRDLMHTNYKVSACIELVFSKSSFSKK